VADTIYLLRFVFVLKFPLSTILLFFMFSLSIFDRDPCHIVFLEYRNLLVGVFV